MWLSAQGALIGWRGALCLHTASRSTPLNPGPQSLSKADLGHPADTTRPGVWGLCDS